MYFPGIISFIFFVACAIYFYYGLMILSYNTRSAMHWLFFFCCLDMSLWALSFSIGNTAADYESCLIWRRIGSIGWGTMFSYFLHYILMLTKNRVLKKKWIYIPIYLPALLNIFLYGIYTKTAVQSYHLVHLYSGWINIAGSTVLDWLYDIYYIGFSLIGIALLFYWGFSSKDIAKRKQSVLIGVSYIVAVIVGTMTEYTINSVSEMKVPQLASIIILIPMSVMFYCVRRYGFMLSKTLSKEPEPDQILSEYTRSKLYFYLSIAYGIGGFVNFGIRFFTGSEQVWAALLFSTVILGFGLVVGIVQTLKIKPEYRQLISNIIITVSIPVIILKYIGASAVYAWAVPVLLMLVVIAFNQRQMIFFTGAATFATLIVIWVIAPVSNVTFSSVDHLVRIILLALIMWFALYINRTYIGIISENREKVKLEKLLAYISTLFITSDESNIDERVIETMELCGKHFKLDLIHLLFFPTGRGPDKQSYEWHTSMTVDHECDNEMLEKLMSEADPDMLEAEGRLFFYDSEMSAENGQIGKLLKIKGLKSLIVKPLRNKDEAIGIICFGSFGRILTWEEQQQQTANLLAHLIADIWLKVSAERETRYHAYYDDLTGLPNRTLFSARLSQAISMAEQSKKLLGVIFIDVDSFKAVNDSIGHNGGDSILVQLSRTLQGCIRTDDFLARFGGDEFLIMVPQADTTDDIQSVAERIMESFQKPLTVKNLEFFMTASAGIAVYPMDGSASDDLIRNADLAMYVSKGKGKNRYTFCSDEMKNESLNNIILTNDLHKAIDNNELLLYYQPQVATTDEKIVGVEALVRWKHPEKGIIMPGVFIPLAEKYGLISQIGQWVLFHACMQNKVWQENGLKPVKIAVNLSLGQFLTSNLVEVVKATLEKTSLSPEYLELEITESLASYDTKYITAVIGRLKALGVDIAIDDFGTEYSSLSRIKILSADKIKIDRRFICGISENSYDEGIIKIVIQLGKLFHVKVTAEGVETSEQAAFLKENSCDEVQGYYYYRPMPAEDLENIMRKDNRN